MFFGTPHRGGNGATLGQIAVNVARVLTSSDVNDLVTSLQKNSTFLAHLTADFKHIYEDFNYLSIVESRGRFRAPVRTVSFSLPFRDAAHVYQVVVDRDSAELGLPGHREHVIDLDLDHRQICKLTNDSVFQRIIRHMIRLAVSAEQHVTYERAEHQMQASAVETFATSPAPLLSTVNFAEPIKPVGHESLRSQLTQWLNSDSPSVILHGHSGSGSVCTASDSFRALNGR